MDAKLEKIENSEAYIEIEVDAEKFEEGLQHAYRKVVKQASVPGFRKGKVPRSILENQYGKEILYQDALEYIVPSAFEEAVEKLEIEPIAQPDFEIDEIEGETFSFKVKVAVKPEVKLGEIEGIEVAVPENKVTEEEVEKRMEEMRSRYAQIEEKSEEESVEMRDIAYIDFEGFVDGEAFAGGKGTDHALEIGSGAFIPGFEDQLIGLKIGETKDVNVTFPEEYHAEELAGKDAVFKVTVNKINTRRKREFNDEFVQEVSQFETVDEYREDVRKTLVDIAETRKNEYLKQELVNQALDRCEIPVADGAIKAQIEMMTQDFEQRIAGQGLNMDQYFELTNSNQEQFSQSLWPQAERIVKSNFMLEKIVEEKGIEVSNEEIDKKVQEMAEAMGLDAEVLKTSVADISDRVKGTIANEKAVQYLVDNAKLVESNESEDKEAVVEQSE